MPLDHVSESARPAVPAVHGLTLRELRSAAMARSARVGGCPERSDAPARGAAWVPEGLGIRVIAGHAGAGASTIALAVADAAARKGKAVRVLDAAAPVWSGLAGTTAVELGSAGGWHRGRRGGGVVVDRVLSAALTPTDVPVPSDQAPVDLTVLDVGWTRRELDAHPSCWQASMTPTVDVVVSRATASGLSQTETVVAASDPDGCLLVLIGSRRRGARELAVAGPRIRRLHARDAVVFVPRLRGLAELGPGPLPHTLLSAAARLLALTSHPTRPRPAAGSGPRLRSTS
jgi:hypothetical protein